MTTSAQKWGNSLGVRIPKNLAEKYDIVNGSKLIVKDDGEQITIKPAHKEPTLDELLAGITEDNKHEEYFSKPMGRELL